MKIIYPLVAIISITTFSCKPKIEAPEASMGDVDASRYVAIGTNNTAGYANDGLTFSGQENSYAAILAEQFSAVTSINFKQPFISASSVGVNANGQAPLKLGYKTDCKGVTSLSPVRIAAAGDFSQFMNQYASYGPFNNLGVTELSALNVNVSGYGNSANGPGNYNPYYSRFASNETNSSILGDALAQNPTFFTLMLGDDDILAYAKSGGTNGGIPGANGPAGNAFNGSLIEVITSLAANGAKGAIANIPNVLNYPYFNTIPYNGLTLEASDLTTLNLLYDSYGISFVEGENPFVIYDPGAPNGLRKMVEGERVLLSAPLDSVKCHGMGTLNPFRDEFILTLDEIDEINTKTDQYNNVIIEAGNTYGLAIADANLLFGQLKNGTVYNGVTMSATFVTGGAFSLDGIQLNPIGQALLANQFIKAINTTFDANIPHASVTKYSGIIFP